MKLDPLVNLKLLIDEVKKEAKKVGVSQEEMGSITDLSQPRISSKLNKDYDTWLYLDLQRVIARIVSKGALIRNENIKKIASIPVKGKFEDETIRTVANYMKKNDFSQIAIRSRKTNHVIGVVTEHDILNRMLNPNGIVDSIENFLEMTVEKAEIVSPIPSYDIIEPASEIGQVLLSHYAVLLTEYGRTVGIVTRADFLNYCVRLEEKDL